MPESKKVAIITGASQGIGAGLATAFRRAGYAVVGTSRSIPPSDDPDFLTVQGDIAEVETALRVVGQALDRFGRIDCLINNAGIFIGKPFGDYTPDDFAAFVAVNLAGFFHITQRAIGQMVTQGGGHVVNITTSLVDHASRERPSALASLTKGGLAAVTRVAGHRIRSTRRAGQRGRARESSGLPCTTPRPTRAWTIFSPSVGSARSATSSTRSSTWKAPHSSPARSCTSMAVGPRDTDSGDEPDDRLARGALRRLGDRYAQVAGATGQTCFDPSQIVTLVGKLIPPAMRVTVGLLDVSKDTRYSPPPLSVVPQPVAWHVTWMSMKYIVPSGANARPNGL